MRFDIHLPASLAEAEGIDQGAIEDWVERCLDRFEASPEGKASVEAGLGNPYLATLLELAIEDIGVGPAEMGPGDLNYVLQEVFPRRALAEPDGVPLLVGSLKAFAAWLDREFGLAKSEEWAPALTDEAAATLREKLAEQADFSIARTVAQLGEASGLSMVDEPWFRDFAAAEEAKRQAAGRRRPRVDAKKKKAQRKAKKKARRKNRKKR